MSVAIRDDRIFAVTAEALFALLVDPAFQEARSAHLGTLSCRCVSEARGGGQVIVLDEVRDTGFKPHRFESRRTIVWDETRRRARWTLEQTGGPGQAEASGTLAILPDSAGSRRQLRGNLNVRVRLLGGMIERIAKRALRGEHNKEAKFIEHALAERGLLG